tara:strand:- start:115 stop:267 length:153 start_codon:yes stop_codon:yes gene_type:complete
MELTERIDNLKKQQQQLEVAMIKVAGAIELCEAMIAEKEKATEKDTEDKK